MSKLRHYLFTYWLEALIFLALLVYAYFFWMSVAHAWFSPNWTTDDALQQVYPFHKVHNPELFKGDLITNVMEGYLAPLHYWLSWGVTYLVGDPIMMAHWVMLIQVLILFVFLFALVYREAGFAAACFACLFLLHTRLFMQRITGGLPRGWPAPLLMVFLYFLFKNDHKKILITLFIGCLLHPPATLIAGGTYGLYLIYLYCWGKEGRSAAFLHIRNLFLAAPLMAVITLQVVKRPPEIGNMVTFKEASELPELKNPGGRFPFTPLPSITSNFDIFAIQVFKSRLATPMAYSLRPIKQNLLSISIVLLLGLYIVYWKLIPIQVSCFFIATLVCYALSRQFAFLLYVPDRYLQLPSGLFWSLIISIPLFQVIKKQTAYSKRIAGTLLLLVIFFAWVGGNTGLQGDMNFNYPRAKNDSLFNFLQKYTKVTARIAGHPTHIDPVALYAKRETYATTETAHPFYQKYFKEMMRRLEISWRAHFAETPEEFYNYLASEQIDYFVFKRSVFYPESLESIAYFEPMNGLVKSLAAKPRDSYFFTKIVSQANFEKLPYVAYADRQNLVININELGKYLAKK